MGAFLPTYAFACPDKHVTEIMRRMSDRPGHIDCPECGQHATQRPNWSPAARPHRYGTNKFIHIKKSDPQRLHHYVCDKGHDTDEWYEDPPQAIPCQQDGCDLTAEKSIGCQIETFWLANEREGGYYDRSLGMQIFTESQRNAEAKKRGLTIIDGDYDTGKETLEGRQKQEELQVGYKDYFDRVHNDPAYADARAAIDRGDLPQMIKPETII